MIRGFALISGVYFWRKTGQTPSQEQAVEIVLSDQGREYFTRYCGAAFLEYAVERRPFYIVCIKICLNTQYSPMRLHHGKMIGTSLFMASVNNSSLDEI
jgi:hypothetical protein